MLSTEDAEKLAGITTRHPETEAYVHIGRATGMIEMLKRQPDFAIGVVIADEQFWLCDNEAVIKMLNNEIKQAELCIEKKPNKFE